jgi:hypothetical protein
MLTSRPCLESALFNLGAFRFDTSTSFKRDDFDKRVVLGCHTDHRLIHFCTAGRTNSLNLPSGENVQQTVLAVLTAPSSAREATESQNLQFRKTHGFIYRSSN